MTLKLPETRAALLHHKEACKKLDAELDAILSHPTANADYLKWEEQRKELDDAVRRAFHVDTKHINNLDHCMIVGLSWLQEMVDKGGAA